MNARKVELSQVQSLHFTNHDALRTPEDRQEREHRLRTAMALTHSDHESIRLVLQLENGELVEIMSDLIDWEDDYVEVHGGIDIPLRAIVDVGV
jgi:hypothetical protein